MDTSSWPPRFHKVLLTLSNGAQLAFTDSRRFARVRLAADPRATAPICDFGPDPLTDPPTPAAWAAALSRKSGSIKAVLLDQRVAPGVGNWVADEMLFQARVHPESATSALAPAQLEALREAMVRVIALAVEVGADADRFPPDWLFHKRWGKGRAEAAKVAGPDGAMQTWTLLGIAMEALVDQFYVFDPEWSPDSIT